MHTAFIAIGTNQGDLDANIAAAIGFIKEIPETDVEAQSTFRDYAPEEAGSGQPDYRNGVIRIRTELGPLDLLHKLQVIERRMGRSSKGDGSSRPIDLDVLSFGSEVIIQGKTLTVPHPRLAKRLFVLEPLAELAPDWKDPKSGKTALDLLQELRLESSAIFGTLSDLQPASERADESSEADRQASSGT